MREVNNMVTKLICVLKISPGGPRDLFGLGSGGPLFPCFPGVPGTLVTDFVPIGPKNNLCLYPHISCIMPYVPYYGSYFSLIN